MRLRLTFLNIWLTLGLFGLLIPWPYQIGPAQIWLPDLASLLFCIVIGVAALENRYWRVALSVLILMFLFIFMQLWMTLAWFSHPAGRDVARLIWHIFKNVWVFLPFPLIGVILAYASQRARRRFIVLVLVISSVSATIGIIQTLSGGALFSGLISNQRFLGFLTPLPADLYATFIRDLDIARATGGDGYYVGTIFRAHGPFLHPNPFASMLAGASGFAFGLLLAPVSRRFDQLVLTAFLIILAGLAATLGIAGYAAFAGMAVYGLILRFPFIIRQILRPWVAILIILIVFGGPVLVIANFENLPAPVQERLRRLTRPDQSGGFNGRFMAWEVVLERIKSNPVFGTGQAVTLRDAGWLDTDTPLGAHNTYLVVPLHHGIIPGLLFVFFLFFFLRMSWLVFRRAPDPETRALGIGAHLMFVALAIVGIAQDWTADVSIFGLFWLTGALCTGMAARLPYTKTSTASAISRGSALRQRALT